MKFLKLSRFGVLSSFSISANCIFCEGVATCAIPYIWPYPGASVPPFLSSSSSSSSSWGVGEVGRVRGWRGRGLTHRNNLKIYQKGC